MKKNNKNNQLTNSYYIITNQKMYYIFQKITKEYLKNYRRGGKAISLTFAEQFY